MNSQRLQLPAAVAAMGVAAVMGATPAPGAVGPLFAAAHGNGMRHAGNNKPKPNPAKRDRRNYLAKISRRRNRGTR